VNTTEKLERAKVSLLLDEPFFGSLLLRLRFRESPGLGTLATDGKSLYYDPALITALSEQELEGVLAHEVLHNALLHHTRRGGRDPRLWNVAADYAVNLIVRDAGLVLPADALYDEAYRGMGTEEVYALLQKQGEGQDAGKGQGQGTGTDTDPTPAWGRFREYRDGDGGECREEHENNWKVAVDEARKVARGQGKLPAGMERVIDSLLYPKVPWRTVLRDFVERCARNDYTMAHPNARYLHTGFYLPSLYSDELPPFVVGIDTSGSIDTEQLREFQGGLQEILDTFSTSVTVVYCDSAVHTVVEYTSGDVVELSAKGGGGTSFVPVFEGVQERGLTPSCLVYFTDLHGTFPPAPDYPVLWVVSAWRGAGEGDVPDPPFGRKVLLR